jgi:hypothetical protein
LVVAAVAHFASAFNIKAVLIARRTGDLDGVANVGFQVIGVALE